MTRWLDPQEQHAWRAVLRSAHVLRVAMDEALVPHGVSLGEYELLSMLSEAPGCRMRMSVLADLIVQSRSRVSHTATRLERQGWVERAPSREDGRGVELALTADGRARLEELAPVHVESVRTSFLDHLTREELLTHGALMRRVLIATRRSDDEARDAV